MFEILHRFSLPPFEIREKVWTLAIRPNLPGAHIFRICDGKQVERPGPENEASRHNLEPWRFIQSEFWRREGRQNPLYREEYHEVAGRFSTQRSTTFLITTQDSPDSFITVTPGLDLTLQPQPHPLNPTVAIDWFKIHHTLPCYDKMIFYDKTEFLGRRGTNTMVCNMALEFNPAWDKVVDFANMAGRHEIIIDMVSTFYMADISCMWFVDYRMKRNYHVPTKEQVDKAFDVDDPLHPYPDEDGIATYRRKGRTNLHQLTHLLQAIAIKALVGTPSGKRERVRRTGRSTEPCLLDMAHTSDETMEA
ncbi:hypothetical protein B0H63DRAFT_509155 [Podospora didyma]|uniref:Uncharacterized protein n=1 Tax=Podospora didyma TaxID=330526 RepID=A0AAE0NT94_9PEZI|nr:hypothetical protein B0H63DRAFT_509155 [Podospora didyma]